VPKISEPVSRRDESVPKYERVIKDDPEEISKIIGKGNRKRKKEKEYRKGKKEERENNLVGNHFLLISRSLELKYST
jgi:hypothetical protein